MPNRKRYNVIKGGITIMESKTIDEIKSVIDISAQGIREGGNTGKEVKGYYFEAITNAKTSRCLIPETLLEEWDIVTARFRKIRQEIEREGKYDVEEIIKILEIENEYIVSRGEEGRSIALVSAMKALKVQEKLEKALEEIICEYNLCYKYIAEEDMEKDKTEHERLALEITSSCMQTLGYLIDNMKQK